MFKSLLVIPCFLFIAVSPAVADLASAAGGNVASVSENQVSVSVDPKVEAEDDYVAKKYQEFLSRGSYSKMQTISLGKSASRGGSRASYRHGKGVVTPKSYSSGSKSRGRGGFATISNNRRGRGNGRRRSGFGSSSFATIGK